MKLKRSESILKEELCRLGSLFTQAHLKGFKFGIFEKIKSITGQCFLVQKGGEIEENRTKRKA